MGTLTGAPVLKGPKPLWNRLVLAHPADGQLDWDLGVCSVPRVIPQCYLLHLSAGLSQWILNVVQIPGKIPFLIPSGRKNKIESFFFLKNISGSGKCIQLQSRLFPVLLVIWCHISLLISVGKVGCHCFCLVDARFFSASFWDF